MAFCVDGICSQGGGGGGYGGYWGDVGGGGGVGGLGIVVTGNSSELGPFGIVSFLPGEQVGGGGGGGRSGTGGSSGGSGVPPASQTGAISPGVPSPPSNCGQTLNGTPTIGFSAGLSVASNQEVGLLAQGNGAGAAIQGSGSAGVFANLTSGLSAALMVTIGSVAAVGNTIAASPPSTNPNTNQPFQPTILGASTGGNASLWVSNAGNATALSGPFITNTVSVGFGPFQAGAQVSYGGGIWQVSFSAPAFGGTWGVSSSSIITATTPIGCLP